MHFSATFGTVSVLFGHRFDKLSAVSNSDGFIIIVCHAGDVVLWPATVAHFGIEFIITVATVHNKLIPFDL